MPGRRSQHFGGERVVLCGCRDPHPMGCPLGDAAGGGVEAGGAVVVCASDGAAANAKQRFDRKIPINK